MCMKCSQNTPYLSLSASGLIVWCLARRLVRCARCIAVVVCIAWRMCALCVRFLLSLSVGVSPCRMPLGQVSRPRTSVMPRTGQGCTYARIAISTDGRRALQISFCVVPRSYLADNVGVSLTCASDRILRECRRMASRVEAFRKPIRGCHRSATNTSF